MSPDLAVDSSCTLNSLVSLVNTVKYQKDNHTRSEIPFAIELVYFSDKNITGLYKSILSQYNHRKNAGN